MLKSIKIYDHLSQHDNNVIEVYDSETQKVIIPKINLKGIKQKAEDLDTYFKLLDQQYTEVKSFLVQLYTSNGSSYKRKGIPFSVSFEEPKKELPKEVASTGNNAAAKSVAAPPVNQHHTPIQTPQNFYPNNGLMGTMGLSMPEVISLKTKAERYDEVKDQLQTKKDELREEKSKNELLVIDLRKAQTDLAIAEQVKNLAVQTAELNSKGFMDSPGVKELISQLGKITPAIIQNQANNVGAGLSGVETTNLSEEKEGLIDLIKSKQFTDQIAIELVYVAVGIQQNQKFSKELEDLIKKHKIKETII